MSEREICTELLDVTDRAAGVLRFLFAAPRLFGEHATFDLDYDAPADALVFRARLLNEDLTPAARLRFAFWSAVAGGHPVPAAALRRAGRFSTSRCVRLHDLSAKAFALGLKQIPAFAGVYEALRCAPAELVFPVALDGEGAARVTRATPSSIALFIPSSTPPPVGDTLTVELAAAPTERLRFDAEVTHVARAPAPRDKLGFSLSVRAPGTALLARLAPLAAPATTPAPVTLEQRAHPRYTFVAPVAVRPSSEAPSTRVQLAWASAAEFSADYVANLSKGGAYIRSKNPLPIDSEVVLELHLPGGEPFATRATVVHVGADGMGVQFHLDDAAEAALDAALLRISTPRRALVIGGRDDLRAGVTSSLMKSGFAVVAAPDVNVALHLLLDDPFDVELVIAELTSPLPAVERFIETIRFGGADLAVVVVGDAEEATPAWAEEHSVDLVLRAAQAPDWIAEAAVAAAQRRKALRSNAA